MRKLMSAYLLLRRGGKVRPAILMWALGIPIPIILIILLFRGCMG